MVVVAVCVGVPAVALASSGSGQVWVTGSCLHEQYKPKQIILACGDGNTALEHMKWSSWSGVKATGRGTYDVNTCTPSCAAGHVVTYPVTVALSKPGGCPGRKHAVFKHATMAAAKPSKYLTKRWSLFCPIK